MGWYFGHLGYAVFGMRRWTCGFWIGALGLHVSVYEHQCASTPGGGIVGSVLGGFWGVARRQPYSCQRSPYGNPYRNLCRQPYSPIETLVANRKALRKPLTCAGCGAGASVTLPPPSCFGGLTRVSFIRGLRFLKATFSAVPGI